MKNKSDLYRCQRCHRVITDTMAIKRGMGATCYEKFTGVRTKRKLQQSQTDNWEEQLELGLQEAEDEAEPDQNSQ